MNMTENEAIIQLNFDMEMIRFDPNTGENLTLEQIKAQNEDNYKTYLANEVAITALLEIQQYRAIGLTPNRIYERIGGYITELAKYADIGTVDELKALKEKSEARNPIVKKTDEKILYICPCCGKVFIEAYDTFQRGYIPMFCEMCGQAID